MKVKIRGLVFVGFAAAVFAQSAMANATTDAKTVTSKLYVDSKIVATDATNNNATTIASNSPDDKAPSALNVYKFVTGQVEGAAITIQGDNTYIEATPGTGNSAGTWTVSPKETVATTAAQLTGPIANGVAGAFTGTDGNKLVSATAVKALIDGESTNGTTTLGDSSTNATVPTSKNVVDYAEKKANKATAIVTSGTGQNNTSNTAYPTTKAVYDFVTTQGGNYQPKVDEAAATTMYVGKYVPADGNTPASATWDKLTTGTYVSNTSTTAGTYTLDVPAAKITSATTDFAATGDTRAKLATAGTVYDFVNTNYQAKAATGTTVQVGYNGSWATLAGDGTYTSVNPNSGSPTVSLTNLTSATTDFDSTNNRTKLARSGDVYDFVTGQLGNLTIPAPGPDCADNTSSGSGGITSSNDKACALVLAYWSAAESPTGTAGVGLKWVPMAQTVSSGS